MIEHKVLKFITGLTTVLLVIMIIMANYRNEQIRELETNLSQTRVDLNKKRLEVEKMTPVYEGIMWQDQKNEEEN